MRLTNRQLIRMIKRENFVLPERYEDKIRETMERLRPEAGQKEKSCCYPRLRRRFAFAAMVLVVASGVFIGAGKLQEYLEIDLAGNTSRISRSDIEENDEVWEYMKKNLSYGEFGKCSSITSISGPCFIFHEISSEAEFQELVRGADADFLIPAKIPTGFHLEKTYVKFYLGSLDKDVRLRKTEKEGSYIYQIFSLPAGFERNVAAIAMTYKNDRGEYFYYQADLMNNGGLLADDNAKVTKIEMDGFGSAVSVVEEDAHSVALTQNINAIRPMSDICELGKKEYFDYLEKNHILFAWKWKEMYEGDSEEDEEDDTEDLDTFHYIFYWITSDALSQKELQAAADEMKSLK